MIFLLKGPPVSCHVRGEYLFLSHNHLGRGPLGGSKYGLNTTFTREESFITSGLNMFKAMCGPTLEVQPRRARLSADPGRPGHPGAAEQCGPLAAGPAQGGAHAGQAQHNQQVPRLKIPPNPTKPKMKPNQTKPNQAKPKPKPKPNQTKPNPNPNPNQTKTNQNKPTNWMLSDSTYESTKTQTQPNRAKINQTIPHKPSETSQPTDQPTHKPTK